MCFRKPSGIKPTPPSCATRATTSGFVGKIGLQQYSFRGSPLDKFDFWRGHDDWARFWPKEFDHLTIYHDSEGEIVTPIMSESIERFLDQIPADRPFNAIGQFFGAARIHFRQYTLSGRTGPES